ncbi:uncharacterized protein LOC114877492 isoform X2 [Osmia bicornis bicornis]|uniref:uncharacterized protein LOC114877492 isoform X2 n=1 Tax=Osmia bicornis bicornis TaxID=1437191 RepID=UPI0010F836B2|nr:uncharacterized protein LOC114877492 isoform X2 [Osmia bicornis bicornis]
MGYYASGDTRKMTQSSEDDEGYQNQLPYTISVRSLNQSNVRDKPYFTLGSSEKVSIPMSSISDDTDRPFWGEDELSGSESTQQLNKKQKRRYTLSHRNRIAVHKSRSSLFQSSSSSLNSISEEISSGDM